MTKAKSTKRALLSSALAILMCVTMLIGTTFAWFTDSVTSSNNKIESGTLKLDLLLKDKTTGTWSSIKTNNDALFNNSKWEPGYTEIKLLQVKNNGTLALKWVAKFVAEKQLSILADVIDVYVLPYGVKSDAEAAASVVYPVNRDLTNYTNVGSLRKFVNTIEETTYGSLKAGESAYLGLALKMRETAGNDYQGLDLGGLFDIKILATQHANESDSFGIDYDKLAAFSGNAVGEVNTTNPSAVPLKAVDENNQTMAASVVPPEAIATGAEKVEMNIEPSSHEANIAIDTGSETLTYDISFDGLKDGNTVAIPVQVYIGERLNPATVKVYHYTNGADQEIHANYDPNTGYVHFESATFSPFTIVFDKDSVYVPPVVDGTDLPVATVERAPQFENTDLEWGQYGVWSPTEGLDSKLEAAYIFQCKDTPAEAEESDYANWYCDFYVKLDKDLGANQIFLGGNYGSFGWIGFHNGDLTLAANNEIPLLGSVTSDPWTYAQVASAVGTFTCGVGDVNNALSGATFTVMLRLTNPENANEYYNVSTINYTFQ